MTTRPAEAHGSLSPGTWADFVAGDLARCPAQGRTRPLCGRGIFVSGPGTVTRVRVRPVIDDGQVVHLRHRCHDCRAELDVQCVAQPGAAA